MKSSLLFLTIFSLLFGYSAYGQDYHVRFGFFGNSITIGAGLSVPARDCYPSQLGVLLQEKYGDTCTISNYAVSGRTMLKHGDFPLWNEPDFKKGWNSAPDICFIMLGTNDSKPYNWDPYKQEFYSDYLSMIDTFITRNPYTKFIVCRPPPAFGVVWDIRNPVIIGEVIPLVDSIAKKTGAEVIDFYHPLLDSAALFPDKIHPNVAGSAAMAKIAFNKIVSSGIIHKVEKGQAFVTSLTSNNSGQVRIGDPATLTWTTVNATEAFLNGNVVDLNGSAIVTPEADTEYVLKVNGALNSDSLKLLQKIYYPALTKMGASINKQTMFPGETLKISVLFYYQQNKPITDSVFDVTYTVIQGSGQLVNQGNNYIEFVPDMAGITKIECKSNGVTYNVPVIVRSFPASVKVNGSGNELLAHPNPFKETLIFNIPAGKPGILTISLYDISGRLCLEESRQLKSSGSREATLNTSELEKGVYLFKLEYSGKKYTGKLVKE